MGARRGGLSALLVIPALAGCLGAPIEPQAAPILPVPDLGGLPSFGASQLVGAGNWESSLAMPDGTMLVCAMGTNQVWASEDGGATWRAFEPFGEWYNGDCDVAVGGDGAWYAVWATSDLRMAASEDRGATWRVHMIPPFTRVEVADVGRGLGCLEAPGVPLPTWLGSSIHRPWLRAVGDSLYLTYYRMFPGAVFFQKSSDGGSAWSAPVPIAVAEGTERAGMGSGAFAVSRDGGTIHVPIVRWPARLELAGVRVAGDSDTAWVDHAVSRDGGSTWTLRPLARLEGTRFAVSNMAIAEGGELYYPVAVGNGSTVVLKLFSSRDEGGAWSEVSELAAGLEVPTGLPTVTLAASPGGGIVAAWYHWVGAGGGTGWVVSAAGFDVRATPPLVWEADVTEPAGEEAWLEFLGLAHDPEGRIHIVYPIPEDPCPGSEDRDCIYHVAAPARGP